MKHAPAFIVGCARSGTSILGEAIASHPRVVYLFEASEIWNRLIPDKPDHRLIAADASPEVARAAVETLESASASSPGDVLVEKNPKHVLRIPFLSSVFPGAKFLHILRDGRDVAASLMFRNRGASWGHLEIPGWREVLSRYPEQNHIRCAIQWRDAVRIARDDARSLGPKQYLEIRYEDLVHEPRRTLGKALEFLGLDFAPGVSAFLPKIQDSTRGTYHAKKQIRHYIENHEKRVGRYEENLTLEQLGDIEKACGDLLRELGYL